MIPSRQTSCAVTYRNQYADADRSSTHERITAHSQEEQRDLLQTSLQRRRIAGVCTSYRCGNSGLGSVWSGSVWNCVPIRKNRELHGEVVTLLGY